MGEQVRSRWTQPSGWDQRHPTVGDRDCVMGVGVEMVRLAGWPSDDPRERLGRQSLSINGNEVAW